MNYTQNYHLPQWVASDRIMMEDFNDMNSSIETGLTTAVSTAGDARDTANSAKQIAQQAAAAKPYVVGSFTGNGSSMSFNLGFRPAFLIVASMLQATADMSPSLRYLAVTGGSALEKRVQLTDTGFRTVTVEEGGNLYPNLCESGRKYDYIAFR